MIPNALRQLKTFFHLLWWRLKLCKWYFLLLLFAIFLQAVAWGTPLVWISFVIAIGSFLTSPIIVYKPDYMQGGDYYLETRPGGWQPLFWSRSIVGILLNLLAIIILTLFLRSQQVKDIEDQIFIFTPLLLNIYFWSAGGIVVSRRIDIGNIFGVIPFAFLMFLHWKYAFKFPDSTITLFPEGIPEISSNNPQHILVQYTLNNLTPIFSLGILGVVECSKYRKRFSLPLVPCILLLAFIGIIWGGNEIVRYHGETQSYQFDRKQYSNILGYRQVDRDILLIMQTRQDNNTLVRLNIDDPTAKPSPVCIVGATWGTTQPDLDFFGMGMPGMGMPGMGMPGMGMPGMGMPGMGMPGMGMLMFDMGSEMEMPWMGMNGATYKPLKPYIHKSAYTQTQDLISERLNAYLIETLFPPRNIPYNQALILEDRILLAGYRQYELLEFDGKQVNSILPPQKVDSLIRQYKQISPDQVSICIASNQWIMGEYVYDYKWKILNLRTGEITEDTQQKLPIPPNLQEVELGDIRYRLNVTKQYMPDKLIIEDRNSPSGTGILAELPPMQYMVADKHALAGFVCDGTHWPNWKIRLYDVHDPSHPTYIDIDFPIQFHDPATLTFRIIDNDRFISTCKNYFLIDYRLSNPYLMMGGGYLACCHTYRIAFWDISNLQEPQFLGTAPKQLCRYYYCDSPFNLYLNPFDTLKGPTTPFHRADGALGYVNTFQGIDWFKFPAATAEEKS